MSSPLHNLQDLITDFPGIGPRQARRIAHMLLNKDEQYVRQFIEALQDARSCIKRCADSAQLFYAAEGTETLAPLARDPNREDSSLLVVEKDVDIENIERAGSYNGRYFVLGGTIPVSSNAPHNDIRISQLIEVVTRKADQNGLCEIILGMSFHPEGEHTAQYVKNQLSDITRSRGLTISTLARGLSTGTELEYSDEDTLRSALENRK